MSPEPFDLRRFAPPTGVKVTLRNGATFTVPGDPDVDDVAVMLRIEGTINDASGTELADALVEGKDVLRRLILSADPSQDVSGLRIGGEEMMLVFALIMHGASVAEAVGEAITVRNTPDEAKDADGAGAAVDEVDAGPLSRSESSSSGRSSGSDVAEGSLLPIG